MVSIQCYETKIILNELQGCGYGRDEVDSFFFAIKNFFDILIDMEQYK